MTPPIQAIAEPDVVALPMSGADIGAAEIAAVTEVLSSGCLSIGPQLERFEQQAAGLTGSAHAVGVSSGTAGLHLAVVAAGIEPNDLVITTPFSFVASANCVLYERAVPVFVDVDPATGNIDPDLVAEAAHDLRRGGAASQRWLPRRLPGVSGQRHTGALKALLPVHAFGQPADMDPILQTGRDCGAFVIEDACEAVGAEYKGRPAGSMGDAGVFAFYPNKQATTGEGGMILTNRGDWAARFRSLRNQGRDTMSAWLQHDRLGYNYRMDELSAALGTVQFSRLSVLLAARNRIAALYDERLAHVPGVKVPCRVSSTTRMSWFAYVIRLAEELDRTAVMADLAARGIPSRPYFSPIHLQPFYAERFGYQRGDFPVTECLGAVCLALPFSGTMTLSQAARVCDEVADVVARRRSRTRAVPASDE